MLVLRHERHRLLDLLKEVALNHFQVEKLDFLIALQPGAANLCLKQESLWIPPEQ